MSVRFTETLVQAGGGPNPTDAFALKLGIGESTAAPTDAMSVAFTFPEAVAAQSDLLQLAVAVAEATPALSDLLLRIGLGLADTTAAPTDLLALAITFSESVGSQSELLQLAFTLAEASAAPADALLQLAITWAETSAAPTDAGTYLLNLLQAEAVAAQSDLLTVLSVAGFGDTSAAPTDSRSGLAKLWGTGSTGTSHVTSPANADGVNNATNATMQTAVAGATTETLTTLVTQAPAAGTPFTAVLFKGWYRLQTTLSTSTAKLVIHSSSALFSDITVETLSAVSGDNNHLTTPFTLDVSATLNTIAKIKSVQFLYSTTDAAAGVSPAVVTVDASSLELSGAL